MLFLTPQSLRFYSLNSSLFFFRFPYFVSGCKGSVSDSLHPNFFFLFHNFFFRDFDAILRKSFR
jgi:hypothetical protein